MFERFTQQAIKVIMLAQEEARRLGHNFVGTEQILLGLIDEGTGIAAKCLIASGVNLKDARKGVEKIIGRGSGFVAVEIPFTPRAKRVMELGWNESRRLGTDYIATEHLLLGLLTEGEGVAARVLENLDVNVPKLKEMVLKAIPGGKVETQPAGSAVHLDSARSVRKLYETERPTQFRRTTNSFLKFLVDLLPASARKIFDELEETVRNKEDALLNAEYDEAAILLDKQIELTEKLRRCSENGNV
jgi:ATP-dependent Clp protease ATP-binding subunit ClpA